MTKKEMFNTIATLLADNAEIVDFCNYEISLLEKRNSASRKPSKTQVENSGFKADILVTLAEIDRPVSIRELCEGCPNIAGLTNQRITHLLTDLRNDGKVTRTYIKKIAYFSLGDERALA